MKFRDPEWALRKCLWVLQTQLPEDQRRIIEALQAWYDDPEHQAWRKSREQKRLRVVK